ncbi:ribonuclease HI family protein [Luteococcus sp. H138]|uniref:ribonuclease HI family protein n=1 Tax=unclassified Luteococcus TaxID=2639923 RepID=UPI00313F0356
MITAAADGSSLSNPGPAGWAWYIDDNTWAAGGWPHGTNNMGELMAVLNLLQQTAVAPEETLLIQCDSQYVINSVTKWMPGWKRKGWKKADGKPVMNVDLLKEIDRLLVGRSVKFEWVKGHAGHEMNEAADARAQAAARAYRDGTAVPSGPGFRGAGAGGAISLDVAPNKPEPVEIDLFSFDEEPAGGTDADDVVALEESLLLDSVRSDKRRVEALLHPDFTEIGASGKLWSRARMLASIEPLTNRTTLEVIGVDKLADDVILLRWRSRSRGAIALRSSVWVRTAAGWQLRFHQGTPAGL